MVFSDFLWDLMINYYNEANALEIQKQQLKEKNQEQNEAITEEIQKDGNEMEIKEFENLPKLFITPTEK